MKYFLKGLIKLSLYIPYALIVLLLFIIDMIMIAGGKDYIYSFDRLSERFSEWFFDL